MKWEVSGNKALGLILVAIFLISMSALAWNCRDCPAVSGEPMPIPDFLNLLIVGGVVGIGVSVWDKVKNRERI